MGVCQQREGGVTLHVKVTAGAGRSRVAGVLGDRLKVAVAAAPEHGKANAALCRLIAQTLDVPLRDVAVATGHTQPRKTLTIRGLTPNAVHERLGIPLHA